MGNQEANGRSGQAQVLTREARRSGENQFGREVTKEPKAPAGLSARGKFPTLKRGRLTAASTAEFNEGRESLGTAMLESELKEEGAKE